MLLLVTLAVFITTDVDGKMNSNWPSREECEKNCRSGRPCYDVGAGLMGIYSCIAFGHETMTNWMCACSPWTAQH